jgi:endonuclease YncB( thermonuclease family)
MGNFSCKTSLFKIKDYETNKDSTNIVQTNELIIIDNNEALSNEALSNKDKIVQNYKDFLYNSTPKFNEALNNKFLIGRVVDIYDGDTLSCVINIFDNYFLFNIRLENIDTCEIKSKNFKCKTKAHEARNCLYELISKQINNNIFIERIDLRVLLESEVYLVNILCGTLDKYGRLLGWIFDIEDISQDKTKSFNHLLINKKLAYIYKGDTKLTEDEQIKILN